MTFQQQVAIWLTLTLVSGEKSESFVLVPLNRLALVLWAVVTLPSRWAARLELLQARVSRWLNMFPFGDRGWVWAIG